MITKQTQSISQKFQQSFKIKLSTTLVIAGVASLFFITPAITGSSVANLEKSSADTIRLALMTISGIAIFCFKKAFN